MQVLYLETTAAGGITWEEADSARLSAGSGAGSERAPKRKLSIKIPRWCGRWAVGTDDFAEDVVGAKSKNLAGEGLDLYTKPLPWTGILNPTTLWLWALDELGALDMSTACVPHAQR